MLTDLRCWLIQRPRGRTRTGAQQVRAASAHRFGPAASGPLLHHAA